VPQSNDPPRGGSAVPILRALLSFGALVAIALVVIAVLVYVGYALQPGR
jgi:Ni/Fe-hydrogenase subunit HybB-like protein